MNIIGKVLKYLLNKDYRFMINNYLGFYQNMPDDVFLKKIYSVKMGKKLDLDNPKTFNEKLQWLKINDRKPLYTSMVDKLEVKEYVSNIIGNEHIVPTIGTWNSFGDIDFRKLPVKFVLKCTHDSNSVVVCRDKFSLDLIKAEKQITKHLKRNYFWTGREWPYRDVIPRIMAEKYMEDEYSTELLDYKFFCFNQVPKFLYISKGLENHETARISFYDLKGRELEFHREDYKQLGEISLPQNFNEMKRVAETISKAVAAPFVRIDLYSINNKTYFSEITFTPCAGFIPFDPPEWDDILGSWIKLPIDE